jgi:hypothetical protein
MFKARKVTPEMASSESEERARKMDELNRSIHGDDADKKKLVKAANDIVESHRKQKAGEKDPIEAFNDLFR